MMMMLSNLHIMLGIHAVVGLALGIGIVYLMKLSTRKKLPWFWYPAIAFFGAFVFALNATFFDVGYALLYWQFLSFVLLAIASFDLAFRLIPLPLMLLLLILVFGSLFISSLSSLSLGGAFIGAGLVGGIVLLLYALTRGRGIGEADVLLAFIIGLLFGWSRGLIVFSAANFLGLIAVVPYLILFGRDSVQQIPLVTFLVMAILLEWYLGYTELLVSFIGFS